MEIIPWGFAHLHLISGGYGRGESACPGDRPRYRDFRRRARQEHLLGTFIKTPTSHATEILGLLGFDFVVFDQEHAALGRGPLTS